MLSRWYAIFLGIILLVMGIAGLAAPRLITGLSSTSPLTGTAIVWIITSLVALYFGFGVRNVTNVRWFAGIVGALYLIWGIISMISMQRTVIVQVTGVLATVSGLLVLLGALGLAAALAPAYWMREEEVYAPGHA